jgi:hypothetical protein
MQYKAEEPIQLGSDIKIDLVVLQLTLLRDESYEMKNDFAIRMSLKMMLFLQCFSEGAMVVYFAVDCKDECGIIVGDGLSAGIYTPCYQVLVDGNNDGVSTDTDDCQALVTKDGVVLDNIARPVWSAVPERLGHLEGRCLELSHRFETFVAREDSTHCRDVGNRRGREGGFYSLTVCSWGSATTATMAMAAADRLC